MSGAGGALRIYVPRDAAALGVGADETALAIVAEAKRRGIDIEYIKENKKKEAEYRKRNNKSIK